MLAWKAVDPETRCSFRGEEDPWQLGITKSMPETKICHYGYHASRVATDALWYVPSSFYATSLVPPLLMRVAVVQNEWFSEQEDRCTAKFVCNRMRPLFILNITDIVETHLQRYIGDDFSMGDLHDQLAEHDCFSEELENEIYYLYQETYPHYYKLERWHYSL